jgi:membrane-anchored mycosin MYCP
MDAYPHDRIYDYRTSEFVVTTRYLGLVMSYLSGSGAYQQSRAPELGLSLVTLPDVAAAARHVRSLRETAGARAPVLDEELAQRRPLERLLAELRALIGHRYGGWVPELGKNRVMQGLHLFPYPDFGGEGAPVALAPGSVLHSYADDREAGRHARVVVLDTAIFPNSQLAGRYVTADAQSLLPGADDEPRQWWTGHSTFLAGLILQRAPAAELEVESMLRADGSAAVDVWEVARRLVQYADSGADVVNLSFGCFTVDGQPPLVLDRAIARLTPRMVVVAAAGNYGDARPDHGALPGPATPVWPAAFADVVAVGASTPSGAPAAFTPKAPWVDVLAPGVGVTSTYLAGTVMVPDPNLPQKDVPQEFFGMAEWAGTSQAAAAVSGAIAARVVRGRRTAYEALDDLREGVDDPSSTGIEAARLPRP